MMNEVDSADLEAQEEEILDGLIEEATELMQKFDFAGAYGKLSELPPVKTERGRKLLSLAELLRSYFRGLKLYIEGHTEEGETQLKKFIRDAPEELNELKDLAERQLALFSADAHEFAQRSGDLGFLELGYMVSILEKGTAEFSAAFKALRLSNRNEFQLRMANAIQLYQGAEQEMPIMKELIRANSLGYQLAMLLEQQMMALSQYDFDLVRRYVTHADKLAIELKQLSSNTEVAAVRWGLSLGGICHSTSVIFADLAEIIRGATSKSVSAKHLEDINKTNLALQDVRSAMEGELYKQFGLSSTIRDEILIALTQAEKIVRNLRVVIVPSRQEVLSLAGLASAIGFLLVLGLTLLIGKSLNVELSSTLVLALAAFFGLVSGFGYSALKFRGFLLDLITPHKESVIDGAN